jgi:isopenicillin-N N-acyltransferase like protein
MTSYFKSTEVEPFARGQEFGKIYADKIGLNISLYQKLFGQLKSNFDVLIAGRTALEETKSFAPALHTEMLGMAEGASVDPALIGMLNARTEILAVLKANTHSECSAVIHAPSGEGTPIAVQTWDWYYALKNSWLAWEIPQADGSVTKTMTEYGIVGKSGMNTRGIGVLFTILHHRDDGLRIGVPVHVVSRWLLDSAQSISVAKDIALNAKVSASSSLNLISYRDGLSEAVSVELHPSGPSFVKPNANGFLIHTNHFLAQSAAKFDTGPLTNPDTLSRFEELARETSTLQSINFTTVLKIMASHAGGDDAVCCHHNSAAAATEQYETLSTVVIDLSHGTMDVHAGGPCSHPFVR